MDKEITPEKLNRALGQASDAKLVALNRNVIDPMLDQKIELGLVALCQRFKTNGSIAMEQIALISICRDLKDDFKALALRGERANQVINMFPTNKQGE